MSHFTHSGIWQDVFQKIHKSIKLGQNLIIVKILKYQRKVKLLHVKQSACWNKKLRFGSIRHL